MAIRKVCAIAKPFHRKIATALTIGSLLLLSSQAQAQSNNTVHKLGILTPSDPQLGDGSYFDSYEIEGSAGQQVSISLDSIDFDAFLGLVDSEGNLVASNDDATATNQNSFLSLALPKDDVYTVITTSRIPQTDGDYRLALRNFSPPSQTASSGQSELRPVYNPAAIGLLALLGGLMFGGGGGDTYTESSPDYVYRDRPYQSAPQPAARPVEPIGGNRGFYGTDHRP